MQVLVQEAEGPPAEHLVPLGAEAGECSAPPGRQQGCRSDSSLGAGARLGKAAMHRPRPARPHAVLNWEVRVSNPEAKKAPAKCDCVCGGGGEEWLGEGHCWRSAALLLLLLLQSCCSCCHLQ